MALDLDGKRPRYFMERAKVETQQGFPLHDDVTDASRRRLVREILRLAWQTGSAANPTDTFSFAGAIGAEIERIVGPIPHLLASSVHTEEKLAALPLEAFLTALEIAAGQMYLRRRMSSDVEVLQSVLADDLSCFRFVDVGKDSNVMARFQIQKIDNEHLHRTITDRTFEVTRIAELASAQRDYADAWKHYSKGDLDDAVSNAGKAVESACKAVIKKVDPASTPDNLNLAPLVTLLVQRDIIPAALNHIAVHLEQILRGSGGLRNQAGTGAHGSVEIMTPEASVALLALRLSGSLISFLGERWQQIQATK
jgi:hypothetical protein